MIPKWLFGQVVFGGMGCQVEKKTHICQKRVFVWPCRLRRQGQQKHSFFEKVWLFGLGTPSLQKNTGPKNNFGIPLARAKVERRIFGAIWPKIRRISGGFRPPEADATDIRTDSTLIRHYGKGVDTETP